MNLWEPGWNTNVHSYDLYRTDNKYSIHLKNYDIYAYSNVKGCLNTHITGKILYGDDAFKENGKIIMQSWDEQTTIVVSYNGNPKVYWYPDTQSEQYQYFLKNGVCVFEESEETRTERDTYLGILPFERNNARDVGTHEIKRMELEVNDMLIYQLT